MDIKKLGVTALAGSLATMGAANAAEFSVTGAGMLTYVSEGGDGAGAASSGNGGQTGNPFGMKTNIAYTASGEMDNGFGVTLYIAGKDNFAAGSSSASLTIDMNDMGKVIFDQGTGSGLDAIDDKMPTANEEVWDGITGSATGLVGFGNSGKLSYSNSFDALGGINYTLAYLKAGAGDNSDGSGSGAGATGSATEITLSASPIDGMTIYLGRGEGNDSGQAGEEADEHATAQVVYNVGNFSLGYGAAKMKDGSAASASLKTGTVQKTELMGITIAVNDNLSVGYGEKNTEYDKPNATDVDNDVKGISFSYTMGSMTLKGNQNESDNVNGTANVSDEDTEIALVFAF